MRAWLSRIDRADPSIRLDRGQLDLCPPVSLLFSAVRELGARAYLYSQDSSKLKDALSADLLRTRGVRASPEQLVVTHGAIGAIAATFQALCRAGDRVLLPRPVWPAIVDLVRLANADPVFYPCRNARDLDDLPAWIARTATEDTRVLLVNFPHNPTGLWATLAQARAIIEAARRQRLTIVSDEAYQGLAPGGCLGGLVSAEVEGADDVVLVLSMSKRFAAPGLRVGFVRAPERCATAIDLVSHLHEGGVGELSRHVAAQLLDRAEAFTIPIQMEVERRRQVAEATLGAAGLRVARRRGGIYTLCDVPDGGSGWRVARIALRNGVGLVPGEVFGCPNTFRISLSVPSDELRAALDRICYALVKAGSSPPVSARRGRLVEPGTPSCGTGPRALA